MWATKLLQALELGCLLVLVKICYQVFHNLYISPLKRFPGPVLYSITSLPYDISCIRGDAYKLLAELHAKYGPIVRIRPNELSYIDGCIWKDAYTIRPGHEEWEKGDIIHPVNGIPGIIGSLRKDHRRFRRSLAHAFSKQGLRDQEPRIRQHVDGMVHGIGERSNDGLVDISAWLSWTTTDIIGDLAFGAPFGCVDSAAGHHFMESTLNLMPPSMWMGIMSRWGLKLLALVLMPRDLVTGLYRNAEYTYVKLRERINLGKERGDFFDHVLKYGVLDESIRKQSQEEKQDLLGFTFEELHSTATEIVFAGSETTATVLSGAIFHLLQNADVHARLVNELRSTFTNGDDITIDSTNIGSLPYLDAVLQEALRIYHPAPLFAGRIAPLNGDTINGVYLPAGTRVSCPVGVASISEYNFARPGSFVPERWLQDRPSEFQNDNPANVFQPFSYGTRNCIGMYLSHAEMHLILSKLLWHFDIKRPVGDKALMDEWLGWVDRQKIWFTWQKGPLMVEVKSRQDQRW